MEHVDVAVIGSGGGLKIAMTAAAMGLKTVLLPRQNKKDLVEIPSRVKRDLKFIFVDRMDEVLPVALLPEAPVAIAEVKRAAKGRRTPSAKSN